MSKVCARYSGSESTRRPAFPCPRPGPSGIVGGAPPSGGGTAQASHLFPCGIFEKHGESSFSNTPGDGKLPSRPQTFYLCVFLFWVPL